MAAEVNRLGALVGDLQRDNAECRKLLRLIREHPACNASDCLHGDKTLAAMIDALAFP